MLVTFLTPFKMASDKLNTSNYPTTHLLALWKSTLLDHCVVTPADPKALEILKCRLVLDHHAKLGVLLWPKFKQLCMFTIVERDKIYQSARSELKSIPRPKESDTDPPVSITPTECTAVVGPSVKFSQWENVDDRDIAVDELNAYLNKKMVWING